MKNHKIKEKICNALNDAYKKLKEELENKGIIRVEDYLYKGDIIFGIKYSDGLDTGDNSYILDDGDIYTLDQLLDEGFKLKAVTGKEIFEEGYNKGKKDK